MWSLRVWVWGTMASCLLGCGVKKADNVVNLALWIDLSELGDTDAAIVGPQDPIPQGFLGGRGRQARPHCFACVPPVPTLAASTQEAATSN